MNQNLSSIYSEQIENSGMLFTLSILELCSVEVDDSGTYSCQAVNSAGNDSVEFDVRVQQGIIFLS